MLHWGCLAQSVWAYWTYWTYSCPPVCSQESLHFIQSAVKKDISAECVKAWPGIQTLWSTTPPFLFSLHPQPSTHSLHPSLFPLPYPPSPHPQLAAEDGFSESSWDQDQRQITADVYAKCNMETPQLCPHY